MLLTLEAYVAHRVGLEPTAYGFGDRCSAIELSMYLAGPDGIKPPSLRLELSVVVNGLRTYAWWRSLPRS